MVQALPPGRTDPQQKMQPRALPGPGRPQSRVPLPDSFRALRSTLCPPASPPKTVQKMKQMSRSRASFVLP